MPDPQAPINPFVYTDTPTGYATPEQIAQLRSLSQYNMTGMPEAKSWAGVLGHALGGFTGNSQMNQANQMQQQALARVQADQSGIGQGGGLLGAAPPAGASSGGNPNAAVSYYTSQGLPQAAAAGLGGAFQAESGMNPNVSKIGDGRDGSPSYGLGQWNGQRARNLQAYAAAHGKSPSDPQVQLDFPLVEMGLKGQPGDPGYKSEFRSGQALLNAQTPQQATAAALMYERPAGYTPNNPMGALSAQKRLAYTSALMGGQGGGGQPTQVAQASPTSNMTGPQYGAIMANPWISQETKNGYQHAQTPQLYQDATGGMHAQAPGQMGPGQQTPGNLSGGFSYPTGSGTTNQPTWGGVAKGNPNLNAPGASGNGTTLGGVAPIAQEGANIQANVDEVANDQKAVNDAKSGLPIAKQKLGQIQSFRALGQDIDSGALPMWQTLAARYGIQLGDNAKLGRQQAYQAMAESLLPGGKDDAFKESVPGLSTTPEGRQYIADYLERQYEYMQQQGEIAFGKGSVTQRRHAMANLPPVQSYTGQPPQGQQGQPPAPPAPPGAGAPVPAPQVPQAAPKGAQAASDPLAKARAAIAKGAPRDKVIQRLQAAGIDATGL